MQPDFSLASGQRWSGPPDVFGRNRVGLDLKVPQLIASGYSYRYCCPRRRCCERVLRGEVRVSA